MHGMKLLGSNRYGVMADNSVSLGHKLEVKVKDNQTFDTSQLKTCHGLALMGHQKLTGHIMSPIIGPIGMI
jgi:hypothetical protein